MVKFLTNLDLGKNELQNAVIQNLTTAPENPKEGLIYYNTTDHKYCCYENNKWVKYATLEDLTTSLESKADKADTLAGYGITDAYTKDEVDAAIAAKDSLPEQTGNEGKFLSTNGSEAEWTTLPEASTEVKGIVELASAEEIVAGTSETVVPTVKQMADELAKKQVNLTFDETPTAGSDNPVKSKGIKSAIDEAKSELQSAIDAKADASALEGKADKASTLAGYGITDAYTKSEIDNKLGAVFEYKGSVANYEALPTEGNEKGDVWNIEDTGANYAWDGEKWDKLSETVNLSGYLTKEEASSTYETIENVNTIKEDLQGQIDTLSSGSVHKSTFTNEEMTSEGGVCTWNITHTLGEDVEVELKEILSGETVFADISQTNNQVTVKFNSAETITSGKYKAVIIG